MLSWISKIIKGIVIALGFILPGISGGVLAAILGIYERMIRFLAHPFKNFKEDVFYFLPVAIGILCSFPHKTWNCTNNGTRKTP